MAGDSIEGYVLVDANTGAMDWDGVIHSTLESAVHEVSREVYRERFRGGDVMDVRPDDRTLIDYRVMTVVRNPVADARVLAALQAEWDRLHEVQA